MSHPGTLHTANLKGTQKEIKQKHRKFSRAAVKTANQKEGV